MKTPEERFYHNILKPLADNHSFTPSLEGVDNKGLVNRQRQILTLGLQKYVERLEEGIHILEYFGEWEFSEVTAREVVSLQTECDHLTARGIALRDLKDLLGIDGDRVDLFHARVQNLLDREEYGAAGSVALLILTLCPEDPAAWISFGVCEQLAGQLVRGAYALLAAIELTGGLLMPLLYGVKAMVQLGLIEDAKELLETTISASRGDSKQDEFRKYAYILYARI